MTEEECCLLLGLPMKNQSVEEVNRAFRRKARHYHPDVGGNCGEFADLVYARDVLHARCGKPPKKKWKEVKEGLIWLLEREPRLHMFAMRMAMNNEKWERRVRDAINVYYKNAMRVVHLVGTLDDALGGMVRIWDTGKKKLFIPLWYPSMFFEDECLLFVVKLTHPNALLVEVCDETHNVTLWGTKKEHCEYGVGLYRPCDEDIYNTDERADILYRM